MAQTPQFPTGRFAAWIIAVGALAVVTVLAITLSARVVLGQLALNRASVAATATVLADGKSASFTTTFGKSETSKPIGCSQNLAQGQTLPIVYVLYNPRIAACAERSGVGVLLGLTVAMVLLPAILLAWTIRRLARLTKASLGVAHGGVSLKPPKFNLTSLGMFAVAIIKLGSVVHLPFTLVPHANRAAEARVVSLEPPHGERHSAASPSSVVVEYEAKPVLRSSRSNPSNYGTQVQSIDPSANRPRFERSIVDVPDEVRGSLKVGDELYIRYAPGTTYATFGLAPEPGTVWFMFGLAGAVGLLALYLLRKRSVWLREPPVANFRNQVGFGMGACVLLMLIVTWVWNHDKIWHFHPRHERNAAVVQHVTSGDRAFLRYRFTADTGQSFDRTRDLLGHEVYSPAEVRGPSLRIVQLTGRPTYNRPALAEARSVDRRLRSFIASTTALASLVFLFAVLSTLMVKVNPPPAPLASRRLPRRLVRAVPA